SAPPTPAVAVPLTFAPMDYVDVVDRPSLIDWIDKSATGASLSDRAAGAGLDIWMVLAALAGGFILNFMPCVLPVIGLKLMSFVNQAGSSRSKVISLNISFVLGILAVMLVLALANVFAKLAGEAFGWGQQFTRLEFQVPMAMLIFAMALSFLGVWEIPIPGFATSNKSGKLMEQEGLMGAFFKGILTTLLATPCSGPFLGTLFGLTLTLSVTSIILLYLLVGIGLGLPYIAICFYPNVIKLLPKPGAWMDTLKQVLAFPLLLTVVYFVTMIAPDYRIATLTLLIVVWFACWLIGRVPAYAEAYRIRSVWIAGTAMTVLGAIFAFTFLGPVKHHLPWIPYNEGTLATHRAAGKTVMIEFTARWCATCQANMLFAIDRPKIARLVDENGVVPLLADFSDGSPEIQSKLVELESLSIPLLAIYPADPTAPPIILRDTITESQLLEALKEAGPSQSETESKLTTYTH
ncbi:MAG: thioredoxin family protein, partial [Aureliella sp.]